LALFNLAIDSKLRGCDVVAIRVEDVAASGNRPFGIVESLDVVEHVGPGASKMTVLDRG
jgi:hypothetical protein